MCLHRFISHSALVTPNETNTFPQKLPLQRPSLNAWSLQPEVRFSFSLIFDNVGNSSSWYLWPTLFWLLLSQLPSLEARSLESRCGQVSPSDAKVPLCLLQLLVAPSIHGLVAASLCSLPRPSHAIFFPSVPVSSHDILFRHPSPLL